GVYLFISKRSGANTVTAAEAVKKELKEIKKTLPEGIQFYTAMDQADMIQDVIRRTGGNALAGGILAILFIFIFLGNWRPTITIAVAIPLSVIATFIALYAAGYTLNLLTLGGLALGIGMLVDNAVVVIENIFRHLEEGKERREAAKIGASEVGMAITASTLTTIAVFFPMVFASGITGRLTRGLALSIAFSLIASLFVALTIVPMLASYIFKLRKKRVQEKPKNKLFSRLRGFYEKALHKALMHRGKVLGGAVVLLLVSFALVPFIGTEFMPSSDRDMLLIKVKMPIGTSLEETDRVTSLTEDVLLNEPEVEIVSAQVGSMSEEDASDTASGFAASGVHEALLWVGLKEQEERDLSDLEVLEKIRGKLPKYKGVEFESIDMSQMMTGGSEAPVEIKVFGKDLSRLKETADSIVSRVKDIEGLRDVRHSLEEGKPEYRIKIDREKTAQMGLTVAQVGNAVQTVSLGRVATQYREEDDEFDVRVRLQKKYRDDLDDIRNIPLKTSAQTMIKLSQVAQIEQGEGPVKINRENQGRVVTINANIAGRDLGSIMEDIKDNLAGLEKSLPTGYFIEYGGQYKDMQDAFLIMIGVFLLASLLVYMIMASQFESFLHPLVIMFTVPLGLIG
ncbi:MAG TPA: efflux RND transporter permease subunit, partial [Candidatus Aminicenantes bacterium]|nr:efflux RND transporter permease subunit [Candidatus Aminicenantes bacterium]